MNLPGTTSFTSVPDAGELLTVSLPAMRAARSRIPCRPKCPSLPRSATLGSIPTPLSATPHAEFFNVSEHDP